MKSKVWKLMISIAITALLITACGGAATTQAPAAPATDAPAATEAPAATDAPAEAPIKIGASLPLTGDFSDPGTAADKGYKLWADVVNKSGGLLGRQVELVIYDNASNPDTAAAGDGSCPSCRCPATRAGRG